MGSVSRRGAVIVIEWDEDDHDDDEELRAKNYELRTKIVVIPNLLQTSLASRAEGAPHPFVDP